MRKPVGWRQRPSGNVGCEAARTSIVQWTRLRRITQASNHEPHRRCCACRLESRGEGACMTAQSRVRRRQLMLSAATFAAGLTGYGGRRAYAACVAGTPPTFVCSGANAAQQTITLNDATVSTVAGFSVNTAAGDAIRITGDGALSYTDDNASPLTSTGPAGRRPLHRVRRRHWRRQRRQRERDHQRHAGRARRHFRAQLRQRHGERHRQWRCHRQ